MKPVIRRMSSQVPPGPIASGQSWTQQMATGSNKEMPCTLPAPMGMNAELVKQSDFGRMARRCGRTGDNYGAAALYYCGVVRDGDKVASMCRLRRATLVSGEACDGAWSSNAKSSDAAKIIMILGQLHEVALLKNDAVVLKAFVRTALKCFFEAPSAIGNGPTWELPERENPDSMSLASLMAPTRKVAMVALHKEKNILNKALSDEDANRDRVSHVLPPAADKSFCESSRESRGDCNVASDFCWRRCRP